MSNQFSGKTAVISGGAGGIGLALASEFGLLGMNIVIGDIDQKQLTVAEQHLRALDINVLACPLDVTQNQQWLDLVASTEARFGDIHMLINNAGVGGIPGSINET
ncbi:MAG: SDR family NAD(P)-dependent oxidoreductase, partial [Paraglaciecola sp.]